VIKVLIVDDSATARQAIAAILKAAPDMEIVGEATDGLEAVQLTAELKPDAITMDLYMPVMNGYLATRVIMAKTPTPIVVVTTINQQEIIQHGLELLIAGALEIVQTPSNLSAHGFETIRAELVAKVRAVAQIKFEHA